MQVVTGELVDGASYVMHTPSNWNRILVLYSHGYAAPGSSNPAQDVPDVNVGAWLWQHGYATVGSSYLGTGWAVTDALRDQVDVLDVFEQKVGRPARIVAVGESLGGLISAGLIQMRPLRVDGVLSACAPLGGSVASWNQLLDIAFVLNTLLIPDQRLRLVHMTRDQAGRSLDAAERALDPPLDAQATARVGLVAAVADVAGWFEPFSARPTDAASQAAAQLQWLRTFLLPFAFAYRSELESRVGGNPSWNTGIDYKKLLDRSVDSDEVQILYRAAGLDLDRDLATLASSPRVEADVPAVENLAKQIIFNGRLAVPVVTVHTTGDGLVPVEHEQDYAEAAASAGRSGWLRQLYVDRAGHCAFSPAELITAFETLMNRVRAGRWSASAATAGQLNTRAVAWGTRYSKLGLNATQVDPAFSDYLPSQFLRHYDSSKSMAEDSPPSVTSVPTASGTTLRLVSQDP